MRTVLRVSLVTLIVSLMLAISGAIAFAEDNLLTVDGVTYAPSHVSGPVFHYETPDTDPQAASTERNVWTGNGSEQLPCEGGIHWIDNNNVLTISHCLSITPTTTTSTIVTETTVTTPETTTTVLVPTTTVTPPSTTATLPLTGTAETVALGMLALALVASGALILVLAYRDGSE